MSKAFRPGSGGYQPDGPGCQPVNPPRGGSAVPRRDPPIPGPLYQVARQPKEPDVHEFEYAHGCVLKEERSGLCMHPRRKNFLGDDCVWSECPLRERPLLVRLKDGA